eukprot:CAMPEP_0170536760 /NCGR_PEP_ID=MMETSP0209-20121228/102327_1 /TAXON_ID=665100 ORGANISM="Litonotus pictus, Strain P1" /NCGR_SAMPLE_ID=MMETSP0209 /ASSEMBLY_ACC=CAM_ASM_000301 /LENGTH=997 /DNA_ID=CAMNT_0010838161 /DNA_START=1592 /DNA_END=4585 /DNA_ORIENTATION=+
MESIKEENSLREEKEQSVYKEEKDGKENVTEKDEREEDENNEEEIVITKKMITFIEEKPSLNKTTALSKAIKAKNLSKPVDRSPCNHSDNSKSVLMTEDNNNNVYRSLNNHSSNNSNINIPQISTNNPHVTFGATNNSRDYHSSEADQFYKQSTNRKSKSKPSSSNGSSIKSHNSNIIIQEFDPDEHKDQIIDIIVEPRSNMNCSRMSPMKSSSNNHSNKSINQGNKNNPQSENSSSLNNIPLNIPRNSMLPKKDKSNDHVVFAVNRNSIGSYYPHASDETAIRMRSSIIIKNLTNLNNPFFSRSSFSQSVDKSFISTGLKANEIPNQSTISQVIADTITKKIIMIIFLMLLLLPVENLNLYFKENHDVYKLLGRILDTSYESKLEYKNSLLLAWKQTLEEGSFQDKWSSSSILNEQNCGFNLNWYLENYKRENLSAMNNTDFNSNNTQNQESVYSTLVENPELSLKYSKFETFVMDLIQESSLRECPITGIYHSGLPIFINCSYINETLRIEEQLFSVPDSSQTEIISITSELQYTALISIFRTTFAILLVLYMTSRLEKDFKTVILEPLQVLIDILQTIGKDPTNTDMIESINHLISGSIRNLKIMKRKSHLQATSSNSQSLQDLEFMYEINLIQRAIVRISALLSISFGEAGCEIIKTNLAASNQFSQLDPLIKGKKKEMIFGFCNVRQFCQINEALQEKSLLFVNEVAEIIHSMVDRFGGSVNKSIGEIFVTIWNKSRFNRADLALFGYLFCIHKINKALSMEKYSKDPKLIKKLGEKFKVSMGFGLHHGWAIEGAIGSYYKIDASYLSPNVNISARLMAATAQYKVPIIISGIVYRMLNKDTKKLCRKIDIVTVKGSKKPLSLYTVDVNMKPKKSKPIDDSSAGAKKKHFRKRKAEILKTLRAENSLLPMMNNNKEFKDLIKTKKGKLFYKTFAEGLESYVKGDWDNAYERLNDCKYIDDEDGPTLNLIEFIEKHDRICPDDWKGCRKLMSK